MGHAMDGAGAPRDGEYREPVFGTNGIYALFDHYLTDNGARNPAGKLPFSGGTWRKHGRWDLTIAFRDEARDSE
jgi:hypothetical protein